MKDLINNLKKEIVTLSNKPTFIHHSWFVKYHLEIVEKIALELCEKYPHADKNLVLILVWMHDYGKIVDYDHQYEATLTKGKEKLIEFGFSTEMTKKIIAYIKLFDAKENLSAAPIEIQIVSSADGASHFVGPFYHIFWKEFNKWSDGELIAENLRKAKVDWKKKVVLPEIKEAFNKRFQFVIESFGTLPEKYLE